MHIMARQRWVVVGGGVLLVLAAVGAWVFLWRDAEGLTEEEAVKAIKQLGGSVEVNENAPDRPIVRVDLCYTKVTDAELRKLKALKHLQCLLLDNTSVTDAGLKELKKLKNLEMLILGTPQVTDAGLKELKELTNLRVLGLIDTRVTEEGLKELKELKSLHDLLLNGTLVTDAKLGTLLEIGPFHPVVRDPTEDNLRKSVGGGGMAFYFLRTLADAPLDKRKVRSGPGAITGLNLRGTRVTDVGLKELKGLKNLRWLEIDPAKVTEAALKTLREIGLLHTLANASAKDGRRPSGPGEVTKLELCETAVTDAGLKELEEFKNLQILSLWATKVTDAGLKELKGLKRLHTLYLGGNLLTNDTKVTDAALTTLREIGLLHALSNAKTKDGKRPSGPGDVTSLDLRRTRVTDAGLKELKEFKNLETLYLSRTMVTDAGLKELKELEHLPMLFLSNTKVTDAGKKELQSARPGLRIVDP
jgi:Leucine-rich repeat (LRR) protein